MYNFLPQEKFNSLAPCFATPNLWETRLSHYAVTWSVVSWGRQFRKLGYLFYLSSLIVGRFFAVYKYTICFVPLSKDRMKTKTNVSVVTELRSGAVECCVTSLLNVDSFFVAFQAAVWCSDGCK
jgi:hypothetical protein